MRRGNSLPISLMPVFTGMDVTEGGCVFYKVNIYLHVIPVKTGSRKRFSHKDADVRRGGKE
jgi:hypothetical protein